MPRWLSVQPKLRLIAAVAVLTATVPVMGAADAETIPIVPCSVKGASGKAGAWQTFAAPVFLQPRGVETPTQDITAYAVAPSKPTLIAVTNGNSIMVSKDGGCSWKHSLRLDQVPETPGVPLSGQFTKIRGLYIAPKTHRIVALAEEFETGPSVGRPHVLLNDSGDAGDWRLGDSGLPPVGQPLTIDAHPRSPRIMYLSFKNAKAPEGGGAPVPCPPAPLPCPPGSSDEATVGLLWMSDDGGESWTRRSDPNDLNSASEIKFLSVDDDDDTGRTLWAVANGKLRKSTNAGASFSEPDGIDQFDFTFTAVETIDQPTRVKNPVRVLAFSDRNEMMRLEDGKGWVRSIVPFKSVESVSQRAEGDIVVATAPEGGAVTVWRIYGFNFFDQKVGGEGPNQLKITHGWQNITPPGVRVAAKVSSGGAGGLSTYFLRDRRRILRFLGTSTRLPVKIAPPEFIGAPPPPSGEITPGNIEISIPVGKTKDQTFDVKLGAVPTPLDLFILVDNSGSMQPLIDALKESLNGVARSLAKKGPNGRPERQVRIGVGQINVQPDRQELPIDNPETENVDESKPKPVYELLHKIDQVDQSVFQALSKIDGYGGSGDEAQLEALWQSATGDGYDALGLGPLAGYNVPPGQDAGWSTQADVVKVLVHATDEAFSKNIRGGHNDPVKVAEALNNLGIRQIGLSQDVPDAHRDLQDMARRTGALAPPGGTDCDGDDRPDIRAGQPLVCGQNYGLETTLVNLINSLADPQELTIGITPGPTVRQIKLLGGGPDSYTINAKLATHKKFTVTFSCIGMAPGFYDHTITAGLRDIVIDKATVTVNCGNVPVRPRDAEAAGGQPPQPPPIQPQPVPAPVAPVQPVPQPQPQTQVQGQTQVNPQAGAAEQKQRQIQVALAENDIPRDEDSLAMVGLSSEERAVAPATAVVIAGMAMASACAGAFAYRRRTQVARATVR